MIHLIPTDLPPKGFIILEGYQAVTDGNMTFIGGRLVNETLTAKQAEQLIKMYQANQIEIKQEEKRK